MWQTQPSVPQVLHGQFLIFHLLFGFFRVEEHVKFIRWLLFGRSWNACPNISQIIFKIPFNYCIYNAPSGLRALPFSSCSVCLLFREPESDHVLVFCKELCKHFSLLHWHEGKMLLSTNVATKCLFPLSSFGGSSNHSPLLVLYWNKCLMCYNVDMRFWGGSSE